jgi:hypothetical protein
MGSKPTPRLNRCTTLARRWGVALPAGLIKQLDELAGKLHIAPLAAR